MQGWGNNNHPTDPTNVINNNNTARAAAEANASARSNASATSNLHNTNTNTVTGGTGGAGGTGIGGAAGAGGAASSQANNADNFRVTVLPPVPLATPGNLPNQTAYIPCTISMAQNGVGQVLAYQKGEHGAELVDTGETNSRGWAGGAGAIIANIGFGETGTATAYQFTDRPCQETEQAARERVETIRANGGVKVALAYSNKCQLQAAMAADVSPQVLVPYNGNVQAYANAACAVPEPVHPTVYVHRQAGKTTVHRKPDCKLVCK